LRVRPIARQAVFMRCTVHLIFTPRCGFHTGALGHLPNLIVRLMARRI
jgi:hypothetical protein